MCMQSGKTFMLDKYFQEMQRVWEMEEILRGASADEVQLLRDQLKTLNTELLTLRNTLNLKEKAAAKHKHPAANKTQDLHNSYSPSNLSMYAQLQDLTHLSGPLTEDAILKTLQARFYGGHMYTNIGPVLMVVNPSNSIPSAKGLCDNARAGREIQKVVSDAVRQLTETGHSQSIILSGMSGSGKTYTASQLLRQLFDVAGGGPETDSFKHLSAAFTVLRSLGSAATVSNPEASRMGYFVENHTADGAIYKTKIHCYFIDQTRIVQVLPREKNYHIFYQMLSGFSPEERVKFHLQGYTPHSLKYLSSGDVYQDENRDRERFEAWKTSLSVLGIPFADVMRVLAAVLLLGNIQFVEGTGLELDIKGNNEIKAVAALLGVSGVSLYRGFTTRTRNTRGQVFKSLADAASANQSRDALAKALYSRTLAAIVRRANSVRRPTSNSTLSTDSNNSTDAEQNGYLHPSGQHPLQRSPATSKVSLNTTGGTDGFVGILDMFGFEVAQVNQLEQICVNLCAETMQHFYNTHIFKSTLECCKEEGIQSDVDITYFDNAPVIELISSQRTGVLSLLDEECLHQRSQTEGFVQKVRVQHKLNRHFFDPSSGHGSHFGIVHYTGKVAYDASLMIQQNRDHIPDDVVWVFAKQNCNFGFASHLFSSEIKVTHDNGKVPRGELFRITPSVASESGSDYKSTQSQDFHTRLDNLLKTLVHTRPHFVRCIKTNGQSEADMFDREVVVRQVRALQVLETVHLMAGGFPHRMRYRAFNNRYRNLIQDRKYKKGEEKSYDECKLILDNFLKALDESNQPYACSNWALGKKHIFLSEGARQQLEELRMNRRHRSATRIQSAWRRRVCLRNWPQLRQQLEMRKKAKNQADVLARKTSFRKPEVGRLDPKALQQTSSFSGRNLDVPPPVPSSRPYTINGNIKLSYPQKRTMLHNFPDTAEPLFMQGEEVKVVGTSSKRGHLLVEIGNHKVDVPYHLMAFKKSPHALAGIDI